MEFRVVQLLQPRALLCFSLVLILFYLPDTCLAGKKRIPPVKHLFGVGIGYQRVVQYKPVLLIQKHRRVKQHHGWGWGGGGGGGWKGGYTPVVIQHHVHRGKGHGHGHGWGSGGYGHHGKGRRKPHHGRQRGWGWRGWRRRRPHKGHGHSHGHDDHSGGGGGGGYHATSHYDDGSSSHAEHYPSSHTGSQHDGYEHEHSWTGSGSGSSGDDRDRGTGYATGYGYHGDHDDHGGYESEIREYWNKHGNRPITSTPHSLFSFTDPPKTDSGVSKIHKEFLKNHLKHYKELTTPEPTPFSPMLKPPHPNYVTLDLQGSEAEAENVYYDDNDGSTKHFHEEDEDSNEISPNHKSPTERTPAASTNVEQSVKPKHATKLKIKPSPPAPLDTGAGSKFNDPSFFPTFEQFKTMKIA